jgi:hypothetical protein
MPDAATGRLAAGWLPALTAILGFVTSSILEWLRDRRTSARDQATAEATRAREREARDAARRAQLFERRVAFQRETLLNLQDAVVRYTRVAGKMHHLDRMEQRRTGNWGRYLLPDDLNNEAFQANVSIMVLISRVRDNRVRELAETFREHASRVGISDTEEAGRNALDIVTEVLDPLHKRIGEVLRKLDEDDDTQSVGPPVVP